jgi:hypothetical protein
MPLAPYDPAALGPSQGAVVDQMAYQNNLTDSANRTDLMTGQGRNLNQYKDVVQPQLESSLGATGQFYGTAARKQEGQVGNAFQNQQADLQTAFNRAHMDLKRQEAFAAMGLIL